MSWPEETNRRPARLPVVAALGGPSAGGGHRCRDGGAIARRLGLRSGASRRLGFRGGERSVARPDGLDRGGHGGGPDQETPETPLSPADLPSWATPLPQTRRDNSAQQPDLHGWATPLSQTRRDNSARQPAPRRRAGSPRLCPTAASNTPRQQCATARSSRLGHTALSNAPRQRCATAGSLRLGCTAASNAPRQRCTTAGSLRLGCTAVSAQLRQR
jgi:hypothetical protein